MKRALFVSPHLDDAVFSAGAVLEGLDAYTTLLTVFTASVPDPRGFALVCQTGKGIEAHVDYMALRRAEDERAAQILEVDELIHLGLPEAPHRGYESSAALFGPTHDAIELDLPDADVVYVPQGIGGHVDHVVVIEATRGIATHRYRDLPYGLRSPDGDGRPVAPTRRKLDACAAYASQLDFQFGGEAAMRAALGGALERIL
ncbi:MAG: PIG-L family deacetylase [Solirubrobacterales bacterium]|nr:PIG-L family deacetylase [Solirubrobacterales bacterium]